MTGNFMYAASQSSPDSSFFSWDYNFEVHFGKSRTKNYAAYSAYLAKCHASSLQTTTQYPPETYFEMQLLKRTILATEQADDQCLHYWNDLLEQNLQQQAEESSSVSSVEDSDEYLNKNITPMDSSSFEVDNPFITSSVGRFGDNEVVAGDYGDQFLNM
jgi:hypothetical protein